MWFQERLYRPTLPVSYDREMEKKIRPKSVFGALLTDLHKAFNFVPYHLIITKLEAYGLEIGALRLINAYLTNRIKGSKLIKLISPGKM